MLIHTRCPIDDSDDADVEVYPASFQLSDLNAQTFSARRSPDRVYYRMVKNTRTGCLRADPVLDEDTLHALYADSTLAERDTWQRAAETYRRYLEHALPHIPNRRGLLEIGCGHGPFLSLVQDLGFERVEGVEPSKNAVANAPEGIREHIHTGFLKPGLYPPASFSVVCCFHVLDHLVDPNVCLQAIHDVLVPGGIAYFICHDIGAPLPRLLGRRCPMIDIEHPVLYDRRTVARLFEKNMFTVMAQFGVRNAYPLDYWARLAPLPSLFKEPCLSVLTATGLGRFPITINLGNMGLIARKV